jgi:hypothetical protein
MNDYILTPLESVAILGLKVVLTDAYNTCILQVWSHLIDIHFILLHMEFEGRLPISVLRIRSTLYKKLQLEIVKVRKSQLCSKPARPLYFTHAFFSKLSRAKTWYTSACQRLQNDGTHSKSKVMEMFRVGFYSQNETMVQLHVTRE